MPVADKDYKKRLAKRKLSLARQSQKQRREKAFSSPPKNVPEKVKPVKSVLERLIPSVFGGMGETQAKAENRYRLALMGAKDNKERLKIRSELNPVMKAFEEGYGGGGVAGSLAKVPPTVGRAMVPELKSIIDEGTRRALINIGLGRYNLGTEPIKRFMEGMSPTAKLEDIIDIPRVASERAKTINRSAKERLEEADMFDIRPYIPLSRFDVEELASQTLGANPNVNPLLFRTTHGSHNPWGLLEGGHTRETVSFDPGIYNLILGDIPDIIGRKLLTDTLATMRGLKIPKKKH